MAVRKSLVVLLITSKRSYTLVNRIVWGSLSGFDSTNSTEVGIVDADEAKTDVDAADGDTAGGGLDAIDAMAKR
ncbi:hypothetical protein B0H67DRAFT_574919 [Lasiosphaeris hirsuta]|uniref:Uncharacterized protein n=1 Tax=Lasiosphaeris hirsuta TaxID=260670 RepID=A0AA40E2B5_9PEZI|nr:hypothetical protein B0H67DRAFT_574919 [Lasiosphaeris hirsuta]